MLIRDLLDYLREFAPLELAEDWDNVGLLIGSESQPVENVLTCLTLTPDVAAEAIEKHCQLIITHHPVLFRAVQKLTDQTSEGRMLLDLIRAGIAVYSPHTSYDSAQHGINRQLAQSLSLRNVQPLRPKPVPSSSDESASLTDVVGSGRFGDLARTTSFGEFVELVKGMLGITATHYVGDLDREVSRVGIACGAATEFMRDAVREGCDVLLTGEARFHACLEARTLGIALVLPGHYATERPAMVRLAALLKSQFNDLNAWASVVETDPVCWA
jgi:dinuclear metal center YbgI/SA1388 family protein